MACAALRARSMIPSSVKGLMSTINSSSQHSLCAPRLCERLAGGKNRHAVSLVSRAYRVSRRHRRPGGIFWRRLSSHSATPWPVHHAHAYRVEFHITAHVQQVGIPVHQDCLETALDQIPHLAMAAVEYLRIHTVKVAHQPRQVRTACGQHEGIVIAHQAIGSTCASKLCMPFSSTLSSAARSLSSSKIGSRRSSRGVTWQIAPGNTMRKGAGHGVQDCGDGGKRQDLTAGFDQCSEN